MDPKWHRNPQNHIWVHIWTQFHHISPSGGPFGTKLPYNIPTQQNHPKTQWAKTPFSTLTILLPKKGPKWSQMVPNGETAHLNCVSHLSGAFRGHKGPPLALRPPKGPKTGFDPKTALFAQRTPLARTDPVAH